MNTKELFLNNKKLSAHWAGIANSAEFDQVLTFARAKIVEQAPSRDELRGVEMALHTLSTLSDNEDSAFEFPSAGLQHEIEQMPARPDQPKKTRKSK